MPTARFWLSGMGRPVGTRWPPRSLHLHAVDARLLGSVLNMMPIKGAEAYGYSGYGYYKESDDTNRDTITIDQFVPAERQPGVHARTDTLTSKNS